MILLDSRKKFKGFIKENPKGFTLIARKPISRSRIHLNTCKYLNNEMMGLGSIPRANSEYVGYLKRESAVIKKEYSNAKYCSKCKSNVK